MRTTVEGLPPRQVNPKILHRLFYIDHLSLLAAAAVAFVNLLPGISASIFSGLPASWLDMRFSFAVITLFAATSLFCSEETQANRSQWVGIIFAALTLLLAALSLLARITGEPHIVDALFNRSQIDVRQGSFEFTAVAFLLTGINVFLVSFQDPKLELIADGLTVLQFIVAMSLIIEPIFGIAGVSSRSEPDMTSIPVLWCLALLTLVVVIRRAERGIFSILWGYGSGSHIARILAPIVLILPLGRELMRARLLKAGLFPARYAGAVLTAIGTVLGFVLLLILARVINRMQEKVQDLMLRDELTGLCSVKGFYLLAEQAFRISRRVQEPFGVLFVDMDNLKIINDQLGHSTGSVSLVETAKLLTANFRETDIIGRLGGDEFVVAGQFSELEIRVAIDRLREAVARKNKATGQRFTISLSMGYAVTEDFRNDTLRSLVGKADEAMYVEKRAKKISRGAMTLQSQVGG